MSTEKIREEFEAAFVTRCEERGEVGRLDRLSDGRYEYVDTSAEWWAWQASRAAIEVELPSPNNDYSYSDRGIADACEHHRRAILAIESLG